MAVAVKSTEELTRQRRVVVTGTSVVTLLGHDSDVFYNNLLEGFPAIEVMETLDKAKCVVFIGSTMGGMKHGLEFVIDQMSFLVEMHEN
ncbi:hypothetical protein ACFX13_027308 [Malus domestica]